MRVAICFRSSGSISSYCAPMVRALTLISGRRSQRSQSLRLPVTSNSLMPHEGIDLDVGVTERAGHGLGPGPEAAEHAGVELFHPDLLILGRVVVIFSFEGPEAGE